MSMYPLEPSEAQSAQSAGESTEQGRRSHFEQRVHGMGAQAGDPAEYPSSEMPVMPGMESET